MTMAHPSDRSAADTLFAGPGEVRERCRALDWATTPLGPVDQWPGALRAAVRLCLDCAWPMCVFGGASLIQLYNDAYAALVGPSRHPNALGRPAKEVWADLWNDIGPEYEQVMSGGPPVVRDKDLVFVVDRGHGEAVSAWTYATSPIRDEAGTVVGCHTLVAETSERYRAEAAVHAGEERQAFLLRFSDALRLEADADAIVWRALALLIDQLELDRAYVTAYSLDDDRADVTHQMGNDKVPPLPEVFRLSDYPAALRDTFDRTLVIEDELERQGLSAEERQNSGRLGMRAMVGASVRRGGEGPLWSMVVISAHPRRWTRDEIALVEEAAERTWAAMERARGEAALRESEEKYRSLFEKMDEGFALCEVLRDDHGRVVDYRYVEVNSALVRHGGVSPDALRGQRAKEFFPNLDPWLIETYARVVDAQQSVLVEHYFPHVDRWLRINAFPRGGERFAVLFGDVSERHRVEAALRESEEKYRTLFETMGQGYCDAELVRDSNGRVVDARYLNLNPAFERLFGIPVADAIGRRVREIVPGLEPWWFETYERISDAGEAERFEHEVSSIGRWYEVQVYPRGRDRLTVLYDDITERKATEAALGESQARLAAVFEVLPVGVGVLDDAGRVQLANRRMQQYLPDAVMPSRNPGEHALWRAWHEDGRPVDPHDYPGARALRGENVVPGLEMLHREEPGGPERWTRVAAVPIREADGRVSGTAVVITDVDSLKRTAEALRASEAHHRTLVENVHDYAIFLLDADGQVIEWNLGAERVMGYTAAEAVGRHLSMFFTAHDVASGEPARELAEAAATGRAEREGWRVRKSGDRFWVNEIATAIHDENGRLTGFTKISRDLTDRLLAQEAEERARRDAGREELRRALAAAEEAERHRIARELHDQLGQELTAFRLGLEESLRLLDMNERAAMSLQRERRNMPPDYFALRARIAQLQALAARMAIGARYISLELRPPELDDVGFESALETYVSEWSARYGIPADVVVRGLRGNSIPPDVTSALYRITQEALTNVAKHAGASQVSVVVDRLNGDVRLFVEDDGQGFDMDAVAERARTERRLGLAGMRERAALAGGALTVESSPGSGTTVFVRVPVDEPGVKLGTN